VTPYGTQKAGQAYNPNTGAYALPIRHRTHTEATETRKSQRAARQRTRNMKLLPRDPWERIKAAREPRVQPRRAYTAMLRWAKAPMARSTQNKTATSTRTPAAQNPEGLPVIKITQEGSFDSIRCKSVVPIEGNFEKWDATVTYSRCTSLCLAKGQAPAKLKGQWGSTARNMG
jgi:hypothetical protein